MNIVINVDENYLKYAAVMLFSLGSNNKYSNIKVYLLYHNIDRYILLDFEKYLNSINCQLVCIKVEVDKLKKFPITDRWSIETYFRLMIPQLINEDRVLYLDVDIIVDGGLQEMYEMELHDKIMAVCVDDIVMKERGDNKKIFNAGVMLINLKKMRQVYSFEDIYDILIAKPELFPMLDQDVLNFFYGEKVFYIDENRYNNQVCVLDSSDKSQNAIIYHYSTSPKPWMMKGNNIFQIKWNGYAEKCDFYKGDI